MKKLTLSILLVVSILLNISLLFLYQQEPDDIKVDYSFSNVKGEPEKQLLEVINNAKDTLKIAIYNLDNEEIADAMVEAKKRGVEVQVITDEEKAANKDTKQLLTDFASKNIPIKINTQNKMHLKLTIADGKTIVTGSFNYTDNSIEENQEVLVSISSDNIAVKWEDIFDELWEGEEYQYWQP